MKLPAFSYYDVQSLVYANNTVLYSIFTDELITAIFWEESLFNNVRQPGGSAVGLGQVEPAELSKLRQYGVYVDAQSILADPAQAVVATSYMLYHSYQTQTGNKSKAEALKRYAGYYYDKASWRTKLISGWEACERALISIADPKSGHPTEVLNALSHARHFAKTDARYTKILFPA